MDRSGVQILDPAQDGAVADLLCLTGSGSLKIINRIKSARIKALNKADCLFSEGIYILIRKVLTGQHIGISIVFDLS